MNTGRTERKDYYVSRGDIIHILSNMFLKKNISQKKELTAPLDIILDILVDKKLISTKEVKDKPRLYDSSKLKRNCRGIARVVGEYKSEIIKEEVDFSQCNNDYIPENRTKELIQEVTGYKNPNMDLLVKKRILTMELIYGQRCYIEKEIMNKRLKIKALLKDEA